MTNELHWTIDVEKSSLTDSSRIQRANDNLQTLHDYSLGFLEGNKLSVNLIAKTSTSVFTMYSGNHFEDYNHSGRVQGFINPYDVTLTPGIKYEPDSHLRVSVSPYAMELYGLESQRIADTGLYTHDTDARGNYATFVSKRLGAEINIWYDRTFGSWLEIQYRVSASSDYIEKLGKTGLITGLFITKVNLRKGLSISHHANLKGDLTQKIFRPQYDHTLLLSYTRMF